MRMIQIGRVAAVWIEERFFLSGTRLPVVRAAGPIWLKRK
jgi:hypothetical protein